MPILDPNVYYDIVGGILPLGGDALHGAWKGFGLSIMVDVLTGLLSAGGSSAEIAFGANHFCGAIRIDAFTSIDAFYDGMASMQETMRKAPRLPDAGPLTFPGEPEAAIEADYRANGIAYHPSVLAGLRRMCAEIGIEYDLE
jgi:LDH2 family malate/lactate/ureidoglycolate dehydrogenase